MRALKLRARRGRRRVVTTDSRHKPAVAPNILDRNFRALHPGEKWASGITYLRTSCGWLYLTVIIDLWDRKVIGWSVSRELAAGGVCRALRMAAGSRPPREGRLEFPR
jgi:transposase InsO family protein